MASVSGINREGQISAASYNDSSVHVDFVTPTISLHWTKQEDALLQKALINYASVSNDITRYAKISALLNGKTIRDVAMRCTWLSKKEGSKRRKEDMDERNTKDGKFLIETQSRGAQRR